MPLPGGRQRGVVDPLVVAVHLAGESKRSPDSSAIAALADADHTIPTVIDTDQRTRLDRKANQYQCHGAWSFRREAFERVGGYPFMPSGQDQELL